MSKKMDGSQGLCGIFHYLVTSTMDANEKKSYFIQHISEMDENTLSMELRRIAEKLEASPKVSEEDVDEQVPAESPHIKPVEASGHDSDERHDMRRGFAEASVLGLEGNTCVLTDGEETFVEPVMAEKEALKVLFSSSHASSELKFPEQQKEESPLPHTPDGGGGPVEEVKQPTEETTMPGVEEHGPRTQRDESHTRDAADRVDCVETLSDLDIDGVVEVKEAMCRIEWTYVPSKGQKAKTSIGNGLFCSVKVGSDWLPILLTCCHILLKEEEERTEMSMEDFRAAILRNLKCKEAAYWVCGSRKLPAKLPAKDVLEDCEDPVIYCDKDYDIIAIRVKDPTKFAVPIKPLPLLLCLLREHLMKGEKEFCIVHIPPEPGILGKPKVAAGRKYTKEAPDKDKEVMYRIKTQDGDSGSPLLTYSGTLNCYVVIGVHLRRAPCQPLYKVAAVLTTDFLNEVKKRL